MLRPGLNLNIGDSSPLPLSPQGERGENGFPSPHEVGRGARGEGLSNNISQLVSLLGPLVPAVLRLSDGSLDLSKFPTKSFEEFREFLITQVKADGIAFNEYLLDSYHKVLGKEEYRPLLENLFVLASNPLTPAPLPRGEGSQKIPLSPRSGERGGGEGYAALLSKFTAEIIEVSSQKFVSSQIRSESGRQRIRSILIDKENYTKEIRADLAKSVAQVAYSMGSSASGFQEFSRQISVMNYVNFRVSDDEMEQARSLADQALRQVAQLEKSSEQLKDKYIDSPGQVERFAGLERELGRKISDREIQEKAKYFQDHQGDLDPVSQLRSKLARLWLMVVDEGNWTQSNAFKKGNNAAFLLQRTEELLKAGETVRDETQCLKWSESIRDFLNGGLHGTGEGISRGVKDFFASTTVAAMMDPIPQAHRAPYDDLKQLVDEFHHSSDMGEEIFYRPVIPPSELEEVQSRFLSGLQQAKRQLWYGYKQHRALSRGISQVASWFDGGDIEEIRSGQETLNLLIQEVEAARTPEQIEGAIKKLQDELKENGKIHGAIRAAEMEGCEQLLGLAQTIIILLASRGIYRKFVPAKAAVQGTAAPIAVETGASSSVTWGQKILQGAKAYPKTFVKGFGLGGYLSAAENAVAAASGEVRPNGEHYLAWWYDSLATGAAMAFFAPFATHGASSSFHSSIALRTWARYTTFNSSLALRPSLRYTLKALKTVGRIGGDGILETGEEWVDAYLRARMDDDQAVIGFDQAREIGMLSGLGGFTKMGVVGEMLKESKVQGSKDSGPFDKRIYKSPILSEVMAKEREVLEREARLPEGKEEYKIDRDLRFFDSFFINNEFTSLESKINSHLEPLPKGSSLKILTIGPGEGKLEADLKRKFKEKIKIDTFSLSDLITPENQGAFSHVYQGNIDRTLLPTGYDLIISQYGAYCAADYRRVLSQILGALREGGEAFYNMRPSFKSGLNKSEIKYLSDHYGITFSRSFRPFVDSEIIYLKKGMSILDHAKVLGEAMDQEDNEEYLYTNEAGEKITVRGSENLYQTLEEKLHSYARSYGFDLRDKKIRGIIETVLDKNFHQMEFGLSLGRPIHKVLHFAQIIFKIHQLYYEELARIQKNPNLGVSGLWRQWAGQVEAETQKALLEWEGNPPQDLGSLLLSMRVSSRESLEAGKPLEAAIAWAKFKALETLIKKPNSAPPPSDRPSVGPRLALEVPGPKSEGPGKNPMADFTNAGRSLRKFEKVRTYGVENPDDITSALLYLAVLHPPFSGLIGELERNKIPIYLGKEDLTYSYAKPTFEGYVDRNSPTYASKITIQRGATPDVLFHEILHALPVQVIQTQLPELALPFTIPPVHPDLSFKELRENILENIRLNETISFSGGQGLIFQLEREQGIIPIHHSEMVSRLEGAWNEGKMAAVRDAFPQFLPHYERNLGLSSIIMAIIVKVEGRTQLTDEESDLILKSTRLDPEQFKFHEYVESYLKHYAEQHQMEFPPDHFSWKNLLRQIPKKGPGGFYDKLTAAIDAKFSQLEAAKKKIKKEKIPELSPLTEAQIPEAVTVEDRKKLLQAYSGVVDRILEDPPADLSKEELASLVGFVRLTSPDVALAVTDRLKVFLGPAHRDLWVTLGLILSEKGFTERGKALISEHIDLPILTQVWPWVERVGGPELLWEVFSEQQQLIAKERGKRVRAFKVWAKEQFIWEDEKWEQAADEVFAHPELFDKRGWANFGLWLFENGEVDSVISEYELFDLQATPLDKMLQEGHTQELQLMALLSAWKEKKLFSGKSAEELQQLYRQYVVRIQEGYQALGVLMELGRDHAFLFDIDQRASYLKYFSPEERRAFFRYADKSFQKLAINLADKNTAEPWSYPEALPDLLKHQLRRLEAKIPGEDFDESEIEEAIHFTGRFLSTLGAWGEKRDRNPNVVGEFSGFQNLLRQWEKGKSAAKLGKAWEIMTSPTVENVFTLFSFLPTDFLPVIDRCYRSRSLNAMAHSFIAELRTSSQFSAFNAMAHSFIAELRTSSQFSAFMDLAMMGHGIKLDPARRSDYLDQAHRLLSGQLKAAAQATRQENLNADLEVIVLRFALYFLHQAEALGEINNALLFQELIVREIPKVYASRKDQIPTEEYFNPDGDVSRQAFVFAADLWAWVDQLPGLEWALTLERERKSIKTEADWLIWRGRILEELGRGGNLLTIRALRHFSQQWAREEKPDREMQLLRFMILKGTLDPSPENIKEVAQGIHQSNLPESVKDELFLELLQRLWDLTGRNRAIDLHLFAKIKDLIPWEPPTQDPEVIHSQPQTEAFILSRLAETPELVRTKEDKEDRTRLTAFAAANLPLQRHALWSAHQFNAGDHSIEMGALRSDQRSWEIYRSLDLPHPFTVATELYAKWVDGFIKAKGTVMKKVLTEETGERPRAVLRLLGRILGSQLRTKPKSFADSTLTKFLVDWLKSASSRLPHWELALKVLFQSGPKEARRLEVAEEIYHLLGKLKAPRIARQALFRHATAHLLFSPELTARLEILSKGSNENEEMELHRLLLSLHYEEHPGHMVSDFFLRKLEKDEGLQHAYHRFFENRKTRNLMILSELGLTHHRSSVAEQRDWLRLSNTGRLEVYLQAIRFLKIYLEVEDSDAYVHEDIINFRNAIIEKNFARFGDLIGPSRAKAWDFDSMDLDLSDYEEILSASGWASKISKALDQIHGHESEVDEEYDDEDESVTTKRSMATLSQDLLKKEVNEQLNKEISRTENLMRELLIEELDEKLRQADLPEFVEKREGLERDLLLWTFQSLDLEDRNLLNQKLKSAKNDQDRLLLLGQASSLEKLLQLGSIHPAVPPKYQSQFAVFQEEVPHRDPVDVKRTFEMGYKGVDREFDVSFDRPIKEGTIGGIYPGRYHGQDLAVKIISEGKEKNLRDSVEVVERVRRYLWASGYKEKGSRTVDDLLGFYQRTILEEVELFREPANAKALRSILPPGFQAPHYVEELTGLNTVAMELLPSRRLKDLSRSERKAVFKKVDEKLIPAMLGSGIFHYDLHPGNIGVTEDGTIILYDVGRVQQLSKDEMGALAGFYILLQKGDWMGLKAHFRQMGTVWDEAAFASITDLLDTIKRKQAPAKVIENLYPKLADYGFRLNDNYVKLLFMFITWEGTKKSFNGSDSNPPGSAPINTPPYAPRGTGNPLSPASLLGSIILYSSNAFSAEKNGLLSSQAASSFTEFINLGDWTGKAFLGSLLAGASFLVWKGVKKQIQKIRQHKTDKLYHSWGLHRVDGTREYKLDKKEREMLTPYFGKNGVPGILTAKDFKNINEELKKRAVIISERGTVYVTDFEYFDLQQKLSLFFWKRRDSENKDESEEDSMGPWIIPPRNRGH